MTPLILAELISVPADFHGGANTALVEQTGSIGHFGGVHGVIEAERYDAPSPGVVLYVTRVTANVSSSTSSFLRLLTWWLKDRGL